MPAMPVDVDDALVVAMDDRGRVACDLPCAGCGYNLRMQPRDRRCPECDAKVERALIAARLRFADPGWLRSMSFSVFWLVVGIGALLGVILLALVAEMVGWWPWMELPLDVLGVVAGATAPVTISWGLWQGTWREPGRGWRALDLLRYAARGGMVGGVVLGVVAVAASPLLVDPDGNSSAGDTVLAVMGFFSAAGMVIGVLSALLVTGLLAARLRVYRLTVAMVGFFVAGMLLLMPVLAAVAIDAVAEMVWEWEWQLNPRGSQAVSNAMWWAEQFIAQWILPVAAVALPVLGLALIPALLWYRARLRDAARMSAAALDADPGGGESI